MDILTNREQATAIWAFLLLLYCLFHSSVRSSIWELIKSSLQWRILLYCGISLSYFGLVFFITGLIFPMDPSMTKDAVLWFTTSGLISTARSFRKAKESVLQDHFFDNLKFTVFFEFVIATYVFPLPVELFLIPLVALIVGMQTIANGNPEHKALGMVLSFLRTSIGILIIAFSIYSAAIDYTGLLGPSSIRSFLLPLLLMIFYFPLTYLWILKVRYDQAYVNMRVIFRNTKNRKVGRYLRRKIFFYCLFSVKKLQEIDSNKFGFWQSIETKAEVDEFMTCVRAKGYYGDRYDLQGNLLEKSSSYSKTTGKET